MSASPQYRLSMRKGPLPGKVFELNKALIVIGREVKNDIVINDAEVSRQHLRLTEQAEGYQVEDLASTNGTFINGQRLTGSAALRPGDLLGLGGTIELEYGLLPSAATMLAGQPPAEPAAVSAPSPALGTPPAFSLPATPPPPAPVYAAPAAPASGGFQMKPWMWAVGGGCLLLALCGCVVVAAVLVMAQSGFSFGP